MKKIEKAKLQIRYMLKWCNIEIDEKLVDFIYEKHLKSFGRDDMKNLKKEYLERGI